MHEAAFPYAFLIPIVAIVGGLAVGAIAILTDHRRKQSMLDERRLMIEKGMVPPPMGSELLNGEPPAGTRSTVESSLRNGIIMLFVGIGLVAAFLVLRYLLVDGTPVPGRITSLLGPAGVLVALIGVGHLVYFSIARHRIPPRDM